MIRLFVGIALPEDLRERLAALCVGVPGAKWVTPENIHLTLRFVGEVGEPLLDDIDANLQRVKSPAFQLVYSGVDRFESRRRPRTLWVGVERSEPLERIQAKIEQAIRRTGLAPESRKFLAHVTLARLKNSAPGRVGDYLAAHNLFRHGPVPVERFTMYSSQLGKGGSVYRVEAEYELEPDLLRAEGA